MIELENSSPVRDEFDDPVQLSDLNCTGFRRLKSCTFARRSGSADAEAKPTSVSVSKTNFHFLIAKLPFTCHYFVGEGGATESTAQIFMNYETIDR